jgi:hypothetical protein
MNFIDTFVVFWATHSPAVWPSLGYMIITLLGEQWYTS